MAPHEMREHGGEVLRELFKTEPDLAVAAAEVIWPDGEWIVKVLYYGHRDWMDSDPRAAEAWLESKGELCEQIKTLRLLAIDPMAFLDAVAAGTKIDSLFMEKCFENALQMAADDGQTSEVLGWLLANPDQLTRERIERLHEHNNAYHYREEKLLLSLDDILLVPEGKGREALINFMADESTRAQDWQTAAGLLPLVDDLRRRDRLRFQIFSSMMSWESEREAAREWLATQPLSEAVRASWETIAGSAAISTPIPFDYAAGFVDESELLSLLSVTTYAIALHRNFRW